jgi:hypothetical protein
MECGLALAKATPGPQAAEEGRLLLVAQQAEQATRHQVMFARRAWRSDQLALVSFAPAPQLLLPSHDRSGSEQHLCSYRPTRRLLDPLKFLHVKS